MSLQGVLTDFGVADVFQLIAQQRKTGTLEIDSDDRRLEVCFRDGQVVRAHPVESRPDGALAALLLRCGAISEPALADAWRQQEETLEALSRVLLSTGLVTKADLDQVSRLLSDETIFELFLWDEGEFRFRPGSVQEQEGDLMVGAEMVLLDALRMRDEWAQIQDRLPDLSNIVGAAVDVEDFHRQRPEIERATGLSGEELDRLFTRSDGRITARRVIDLSRLGTFRGARGMVALLQARLLQATPAAPRRVRRSPRPRVRWGVHAWILALTGALAVGLFVIPSAVPTSHPLPAPDFETWATEAITTRLELALEAHRWRTGAYPESLEELARASGTVLAGVPVDRYSYARLEGGYWLAPKRKTSR